MCLSASGCSPKLGNQPGRHKAYPYMTVFSFDRYALVAWGKVKKKVTP